MILARMVGALPDVLLGRARASKSRFDAGWPSVFVGVSLLMHGHVIPNGTYRFANEEEPQRMYAAAS